MAFLPYIRWGGERGFLVDQIAVSVKEVFCSTHFYNFG